VVAQRPLDLQSRLLQIAEVRHRPFAALGQELTAQTVQHTWRVRVFLQSYKSRAVKPARLHQPARQLHRQSGLTFASAPAHYGIALLGPG
jgi:hypothetical protein